MNLVLLVHVFSLKNLLPFQQLFQLLVEFLLNSASFSSMRCLGNICGFLLAFRLLSLNLLALILTELVGRPKHRFVDGVEVAQIAPERFSRMIHYTER